MVTRQEIIDQFENFGMKIEGEVISKCLELCEVHRIQDAILLVEHWLAYSLSNLDGAEPTVQTLLEIEKSLHTVQSSGDGSSLSCAVETCINNTNTEIVRSEKLKSLHIHAANKAKTPINLPHKNSEKILYTFGDARLVTEIKWSSNKQQNIVLKQKSGVKFGPDTKYMFDNMNGKCQLLKLSLLAMGKELWKKTYSANSCNYNWENVNTPNQDSIKTIGRIASDCDTKLTFGSTVLVGFDETVYRTAYLNFSKMDSFAVFPGQTVMVCGKNPRGDTIYIEEIKSEGLLKLPITPNLRDPLNFVISAGPYTLESNLTYDPLQDLLHYCKKNTPDVIIMCGPFIEADHPLIAKNTLGESIDAVFEKILQQFADTLGYQTTICVVPSAKDVNTTSVYPTCPVTLQKPPKNVHLLSDPSLFDINSVLIGVTSIDVLNHLMQEEFSFNAGDKLKRNVSHLFQQKSFYPLTPAPINSNVDSDLLQEFGKLDVIPHVMVLPSNLKYFIREVHNCLIINPGRIADRNGGTFARLTINPSKGTDKSSEFMACQILKL